METRKEKLRSLFKNPINFIRYLQIIFLPSLSPETPKRCLFLEKLKSETISAYYNLAQNACFLAIDKDEGSKIAFTQEENMEKIFLSQHRMKLLQQLSELETTMANVKAEVIEAGKSQVSSLQDSLDHSKDQSDLNAHFEIQERYIYERRQILIALGRIKNGSFGECDDCGDSIPVKRLLVQPSASLCVGCQQQKEAYIGLDMVSIEINSLNSLMFFLGSEEVA